jgi:MYXO-CTERM domain-containing protein
MNQVSPRSIATLHRMLAGLLLAAGVLLSPRAALAALPCSVVFDQVSPAPCNVSPFVNSPSSIIWQQQIRTGKAGQLLGISIPVLGSIGDTLDVSIRKGTAPSVQPPIFQQLVTLTDPSFEPWIFVDTKAANLSFMVDETFVMEIHGSANPDFRLRGNPFYTEPLYRDGSLWPLALGFLTYVTPFGTAPCDDDQNPCTTDTCDALTKMCVHVNNALPCTDNDMCTQNDVCSAGACAGAPVTCAALDGCHDVGVCNPMTGQCTDPVKSLDCSAKSVCEEDGFCDPASGACLNAPKADGVPCGKGVCMAGICLEEAGTTTSSSASTSTGAGGAGAGGAGTGSVEELVTAAGGCGCSMPGTSPVRAPWLLLGLLLPAWRRRRQAPRLAA